MRSSAARYWDKATAPGATPSPASRHRRPTLYLASVRRADGRVVTLDPPYTRSGNTQAQPQSRFVLSKLTVFDGHVGAGADTQVTTFKYLNGNYDRAERDFIEFVLREGSHAFS